MRGITALTQASGWVAVFHTDKPFREDLPPDWTRSIVTWAADDQGNVMGYYVSARGGLVSAEKSSDFVRYEPEVR